MPDDEQEVCCALNICCGGTNGKQQRALASWLRRRSGVQRVTPQDFEVIAAALLEGFDLAPKDSLVQLKQEIAAYAREYPYEG